MTTPQTTPELLARKKASLNEDERAGLTDFMGGMNRISTVEDYWKGGIDWQKSRAATQERAAPLEGVSELLGSQALQIGQIAAIMKYPEDWDTAAYPTLVEACDAMHHAAFCHAENQGFEYPPIAPESPQPLAPPPGYALVPIELHDKIRNVLIDRFDRVSRGAVLMFVDVWADILAAAPQPPASALPLAVGVEEKTGFHDPERLKAWDQAGREIALQDEGLPPLPMGWVTNMTPDPDGTPAELFFKEEMVGYAKLAVAKALAASPPPPGRMVPMTTAQIDLAVRNAQLAFCLDKFKTFEEALVRKAEAHHGIKGGS